MKRLFPFSELLNMIAGAIRYIYEKHTHVIRNQYVKHSVCIFSAFHGFLQTGNPYEVHCGFVTNCAFVLHPIYKPLENELPVRTHLKLPSGIILDSLVQSGSN